MKIRIVVDANVILSALLGGKPRFILFDVRFEFVASEFILEEVRKYIPLICRKTGVSAAEVERAIGLLPLAVVKKDYYKSYLTKAEGLIATIDPKDIEVLALYLKEGSFLWSEDKHFTKVEPKINLLKTERFVE